MRFRLRSIRAKLLAVFVGAAVVPLIVLSGISYYGTTRAVVQMVGNRTARLAQSVQQDLGLKLEQRVQDRLLVVNQPTQDFLAGIHDQRPAAYGPPLARLSQYLTSLFAQYGDYYDELTVADDHAQPIIYYDRAAGGVVPGNLPAVFALPTPPAGPPAPTSEGAGSTIRAGVLSALARQVREMEREMDRLMLATGPQLAPGEYRLRVDPAETGRGPTVSLLLPVQANDPPYARIGYVLARIRSEYLWSADLASRRFGEKGDLAIVDAETGDVLYHSQPDWIGRSMRQLDPQTFEAATGRLTTGSAPVPWAPVRSADGPRVVSALRVPGTSWVVVASAAPGEFASEARAAALFTLSMAILVLLAAGGVLVLASRRISRSVNTVTAGARRIASGDLSDRRIEVETHDEIQTLAEAFNAMTASLRQNIALREQAVAELDALNRSLEARVQERTQELQELNAALNQANAELKELDRLKSNFLATVSHEFKTPLTSIKAFAEILHDELEEQDASEEMKRFLRIINSESDRLGRLIKNVLDLSRIESGRMIWRMADFPARVVIEAAVDGLLPALNEKKIRLERDLTCGDAQLHADQDRIQEVLANVLDNAIKASDAGQSIVVGCHEEGSQVNGEPRMLRIYVRDHGHGVPAEQLERIFDRFYQVSTYARRRKGGTGLGLAISREIVEHHGGRLWAESELGRGSTFHLMLPIAAAPDPAHAHPGESAHAPDVQTGDHPHA